MCGSPILLRYAGGGPGEHRSKASRTIPHSPVAALHTGRVLICNGRRGTMKGRVIDNIPKDQRERITGVMADFVKERTSALQELKDGTIPNLPAGQRSPNFYLVHYRGGLEQSMAWRFGAPAAFPEDLAFIDSIHLPSPTHQHPPRGLQLSVIPVLEYPTPSSGLRGH